MRREQQSYDPDDRITSAPGEDSTRITTEEPPDHHVTPFPNADRSCPDEEPPRRTPRIHRKLVIPAVCAAMGAVMAYAFAVLGVLRGMIIPTLFSLRLDLGGDVGAALAKSVEALVEGVLLGVAVAPVLALERREALGKPHLSLRGYPRRVLRMLPPFALGGALTLVTTEWVNQLAPWATGVVLTRGQREGVMCVVALTMGATMGAGVGLLWLRFPSVGRFIPFRKSFPFR
jgi:hypothetical protein